MCNDNGEVPEPHTMAVEAVIMTLFETYTKHILSVPWRPWLTRLTHLSLTLNVSTACINGKSTTKLPYAQSEKDKRNINNKTPAP